VCIITSITIEEERIGYELALYILIARKCSHLTLFFAEAVNVMVVVDVQ